MSKSKPKYPELLWTKQNVKTKRDKVYPFILTIVIIVLIFLLNVKGVW